MVLLSWVKTLMGVGWLLMVSCASLKVTSQPPGADIFVVESNNSQPKSLGKTPFEGSVSEIAESSGGGPVVIQVKMPGFLLQSFLVPTLGGEYAIDAKLERNSAASYEDVNKIVNHAFLAERHILQKQYDEALKTADKLLLINDNVSIAYQVRGTVYYVQGKFNESRLALLRALELDGENPEVRGLLKTVEGKLVGTPAAQ
jgi:tetratricopeptide (TPR) repeat protein